MVKVVSKTIECSAVFSDDEHYRYLLTRTWDKSKPKATVLMLNPSVADVLKMDKTIMNVMNFLIGSEEYGSLSVVNLYSYVSTDPKMLKHRDDDLEAENEDYLDVAFDDSEIIIVAWTRDKYITRKNEVKNKLQNYQDKIRCFEDAAGLKPRHPRDLGAGWKMVICNLEEL
ncbi:DUF1643 domain-containing protein [Lysinibacillus sp. NPDC093712]|uniref:DUF1643 domain-containing protein n=1 Tax=Lysinibacillus sp. NPDC093712 TaxID=3390579 RepID=UPI003D060523